MISVPHPRSQFKHFKLISGTCRKALHLSLPIHLYFHPERWRLAVLRCQSVIFPPPLKTSLALSQPLYSFTSPFSLTLYHFSRLHPRLADLGVTSVDRRQLHHCRLLFPVASPFPSNSLIQYTPATSPVNFLTTYKSPKYPRYNAAQANG